MARIGQALARRAERAMSSAFGAAIGHPVGCLNVAVTIWDGRSHLGFSASRGGRVGNMGILEGGGGTQRGGRPAAGSSGRL